MKTTTTIRFPNRSGKDFITELRSTVNQYFSDNKKSTFANGRMVLKTITLFSIYFGAYALLLCNPGSVWLMLGLALIMGFGKAGIGFSIAHDAIHGAYSSRPWVNKLLGFSMNLIGGSAYVWKITHNMVHHTYTNIHEVDEDLDTTSMMRLSPKAERKKYHRLQHLYFPLVYSLATFFWVLLKDYRKLSQKQIGPFKKNHSSTDLAITIGGKLLYYSYTIVVPLIVLNIAWWQFLIGFVAMHLLAGLILGIIFQLAHVVEATEHLMPDENGQMENSWAIHQMRTTSNFAPTNRILTWYAGGLNFQVEHHLFPNICSIHYPKISKIVKAIAEKHQVPYNQHRSFRQALYSHIRVLKRFGSADDPFGIPDAIA